MQYRKSLAAVVFVALLGSLLYGSWRSALANEPGQPIKIMPLGDSLTDGGPTPGSYRTRLWESLSASGHLVDFVGSQTGGGPPLNDIDHEGHAGWRIDELTAQVGPILDSYQPDVVLLMIGSNDILQDYELATAPERLGVLIDAIVDRAPATYVLVASIPPLGDGLDNQQAAGFNAAIPGLVAARADGGNQVAFVNVNSVLSPGDLVDSLHPNADSYARIAQQWSSVLQPQLAVLSQSLAPTPTVEDPTPIPASAEPAQPPPLEPQLQLNETLLFRAINLNGQAAVIDGNAWEGANATNYSTNGSRFCNQNVALNPPTDSSRAAMIRCSVWSRALSVTVQNVPAGSYEVYLYVWEDNNAQTYTISLNGQLVADKYSSGSAGTWRKLGPWPVSVSAGTIILTSSGGDANFSGIEIWRTSGPSVPPPATATPIPPSSTPLPATATPIPPSSTPLPATATPPVLAADGAFYRAINLNGQAAVIDGNAWEGANATNYSANGSRFCNQNVALNPPTDSSRAAMIRCSVWSRALSVTVQNVPAGSYEVYLYVWEDNNAQTYAISLNGQLVADKYSSGSAGTWRRLGPWPVSVSAGTIILTSSGGDANFSGIEIWRTSGPSVPPPATATPIPPSSTPLPATATPISPSSTPLPATPTPPVLSDLSAFLQAQGKDLVYNGQKVVLKGVNFDSVGAFGANIGSGNVNDIPFIEADYADLSAAGANHVRFGISFIWYQRDQALFFQKIDQQVAWARKHGIWITFTVFTTPGNCYEGYSKSCSFWSSTAEQQELQTFWVAMAKRYANQPAVAGYDLLNEPTPSGGCRQWFPIAGKIRNAVAAVAPHQLVFIASCPGPETLEDSTLPRGTNIVYEVHDYAPIDMSHDMFSPGSVYPGYANDWFGKCYYNKATFSGLAYQGDPANCIQHVSTRERYRLNWAARNNVPIYIGEWGATSRLTGYLQYHKDKAELYRDWGVNHAAYTWKHQTIKTGGYYQWGIYSSPHRLDDPARLEAIKIAWAGAVKPNFGN